MIHASVAVCLLMVCSVAAAQDEFPGRMPDPAKGYKWKDAAAAAKLDKEEIALLEKQGLLITDKSMRQVFSGYMGGSDPYFITSDSLLAAFHVLLEESVLHLEEANARPLLVMLHQLWSTLPAVDMGMKRDDKIVVAAKLRAQVIIGVALKLMGDGAVKPEGKLAELIDAEVKKIGEAKVVEKPAWLGPPDDGFAALDYARFAPRGFYTRTPELSAYFRTVSWLQAIPFRIDKNEEFLSILMLGNCVTYPRWKDYGQQAQFAEFMNCYGRMLGAADDLTLCDAAQAAQMELTADLDGRRNLLPERAKVAKPQLNDQLAFIPDDASRIAEASFRILTAYRLPDAVLFQRTTDPRKLKRAFPTGLELCAAMGSAEARKLLPDKERDVLLKVVDESRPLFKGGSLYHDYLSALAVLVADPEKDAPPLFSGEAWKRKSLQTFLGGWSQMRHTWLLQAKENVLCLGMTMQPAGFVEPVPEFFGRMARLVEQTETALAGAGAFEGDPRAIAADLRKYAQVFDLLSTAKDDEAAAAAVRKPEFERLAYLDELLMRVAPVRDGKDDKAWAAGAATQVRKLADSLEKGDGLAPDIARAVRQCVDIRPHWRDLGAICRRLEAMAHKQLRQVDFNEDEEVFIKSYGMKIGGIMLYGGNSYLTPRDDAPRVADVLANPGAGAVLHVGTSRPREMYLLYPCKGAPILCRGVVVPYLESTQPQRLTDEKWRELLDSRNRPALPEWSKQIYSPAGAKGEAVRKEE